MNVQDRGLCEAVTGPPGPAQRRALAKTITNMECEISAASLAGSGTITIALQNVTAATELSVTIAEGSTTVGTVSACCSE